MFIIFFLGVLLLGWNVAQLLSRRISYPESLGLSFLLGCQLISLALFVINYIFGIRFDLLTVWTTLSFLLLLSLTMTGFRLPQLSNFKISLPNMAIQRIPLFIIFLIVISQLLISFWQPVLDWDAVILFDYRAKIILDTGWIKDTTSSFSIISYPLLTSLSHFWFYLTGMKTAMPLYPLFYSAFILVSFAQIKRVIREEWAIFATLILAICPKMYDQSFIAYANLPYTIYLVTGGAYLYLWTKSNKNSDLVLGLILSFLSLWVRSFPFAICNILAAFLIYPKTRKLSVVAIIILVIAAIKYFWPLDVPQLLSVLSFTKWAIIDYYSPYTWIFAALFAYEFIGKKKNIFWPLTIIMYLGLYVVGNYYFADIYSTYADIPDAAQRMVMFLPPAIIWYLITLL